MSTYKWSIPSGKAITGLTYIKDTDNNIADTINDLVDFVNGEGNHEGQGLTYDLVDRFSVQTITGTKTFSSIIASQITAPITGDVTGNATSASKLSTARNINLIGDVTGSVSFDGTTNVNITATLQKETFPSGGIIMWSGTIATIPSGWVLCNGLNNTPNLTDRFIIGAGGTYNPTDTGGNADALIPAHSHTVTGTTSTNGSHTHTMGSQYYVFGGGAGNNYYIRDSGTGTSFTSSNAGEHTHTVTGTTNTVGSDATNANLPPYFALAFIMKV